MKKTLLILSYWIFQWFALAHETVSPGHCSYYLQEKVRTALFFFEMADTQYRSLNMREFYQVKAHEALKGTQFCHNKDLEDWWEER